jgi:predicted heme/steroid binding protein
MFKWFDERFHVVEGVREILKEDELGIARMGIEETQKPDEKPAAKPDVSGADLKSFTLEELQSYDGTGGKPIYIAYKGMVYDLSASRLFQGEKRMRCHVAGKDLTKDMDIAPHGEDLVLQFALTGKLK